MPLIRVTYEVDVPYGWLEDFKSSPVNAENAVEELRERLDEGPLRHPPLSVELV
jgi:hypothetical protein